MANFDHAGFCLAQEFGVFAELGKANKTIGGTFMMVLIQMAKALRRLGLAMSVGLALLVASSAGAGAQESDATLDITVRYPDGSLVTDADVCYTYWSYSEDGDRAGFAGSNSIPGGSQTSQAVLSGGHYGVEIHGCVGGAGDPIPRTWHTGLPSAAPTTGGKATNALITRDLIVAEPGSNAIEVTVARSTISGTVIHEFASGCNVQIWGTDAQSGFNGPVSWLPVAEDGTYETVLAPGTYRAEVSCYLRSAFEVWPNKAKASEAEMITVDHNGTRSDINFDLHDRFNESTGAGLQVNFATNEEYEIPKCVEAYDPAGNLVRQMLGGSYLSVHDNGSYRIRISDCFGMGIETSWYPNAATQANGEIIVVDGSYIEKQLDEVVLFGPEYTQCNGMEVTLRGTGGDDELAGTAGVDVISGLGGNDVIRGLGGDDIICAGSGDDTIFGNAGHDWIDAGAGDDWVGAGWGDDRVYGGDGNDFVRGFKHDDWIDGGDGNDRIKGGWGNDVLRGGDGNDVLRAYNGADKLFGDAGNDVLVAGFGPDLLVGGPGSSDSLHGQEGSKDVCNDVGANSRFSGCETINGD